jgi:hypothetical protein
MPGNPRKVTLREALLSRRIPAYPRPSRRHHDRPVTPEVAGSSPVAPAFDTALLFAASRQFVGRLEVAQEGFSRLHCNERAGVLPDAIEEGCEQASAFG